MSSTLTLDASETGYNAYAKPLPLTASPTWATDAIDGAEPFAGHYTFATDDATEYVIFRRVGGSKASTDTRIGVVPKAAASGDVQVLPNVGVVEDRTSGTTIQWFTGETLTQAIGVVDAEGESVDLTGLTLRLCIENAYTRTDVAVLEDGSITKTGSTISFAAPSAVTANEGNYKWSLRSVGNDAVQMHGSIEVVYAAKKDT